MAVKRRSPRRRSPQAPKRSPTRRTLPRDTPVDTPIVRLDPAPTLDAPSARAALRSRPETIEAAYEAWDELRAQARAIDRAFAAERARISDQGALLLGAVETVVPAAAEGLALRGELEALADEARSGLAAATAALEQRAAEARRSLDVALAELVGEVRGRVVRQAAAARPALELAVRPLSADRRVLQARRLDPDGAVTFLFAVSGRVPSRYDFLFDDSTDDVLRAPPALYDDDGVGDVRPPLHAWAQTLDARPTVWPVKGVVPMKTPIGWVRWHQRGAVMEAELAEAEGFRNALTKAEAEHVLGFLLRLKLEGRLELALVKD